MTSHTSDKASVYVIVKSADEAHVKYFAQINEALDQLSKNIASHMIIKRQPSSVIMRVVLFKHMQQLIFSSKVKLALIAEIKGKMKLVIDWCDPDTDESDALLRAVYYHDFPDAFNAALQSVSNSKQS